MEHRMLTVADIARALHVSRATAYRVARHLPMVRVGRALRISSDALARALREWGDELPTGPVDEGGDGDE